MSLTDTAIVQQDVHVDERLHLYQKSSRVGTGLRQLHKCNAHGVHARACACVNEYSVRGYVRVHVHVRV